eukprot:31304-Pelagococcus_subviridis.AAC.25
MFYEAHFSNRATPRPLARVTTPRPAPPAPCQRAHLFVVRGLVVGQRHVRDRRQAVALERVRLEIVVVFLLHDLHPRRFLVPGHGLLPDHLPFYLRDGARARRVARAVVLVGVVGVVGVAHADVHLLRFPASGRRPVAVADHRRRPGDGRSRVVVVVVVVVVRRVVVVAVCGRRVRVHVAAIQVPSEAVRLDRISGRARVRVLFVLPALALFVVLERRRALLRARVAVREERKPRERGLGGLRRRGSGVAVAAGSLPRTRGLRSGERGERRHARRVAVDAPPRDVLPRRALRSDLLARPRGVRRRRVGRGRVDARVDADADERGRAARDEHAARGERGALAAAATLALAGAGAGRYVAGHFVGRRSGGGASRVSDLSPPLAPPTRDRRKIPAPRRRGLARDAATASPLSETTHGSVAHPRLFLPFPSYVHALASSASFVPAAWSSPPFVPGSNGAGFAHIVFVHASATRRPPTSTSTSTSTSTRVGGGAPPNGYRDAESSPIRTPASPPRIDDDDDRVDPFLDARTSTRLNIDFGRFSIPDAPPPSLSPPSLSPPSDFMCDICERSATSCAFNSTSCVCCIARTSAVLASISSGAPSSPTIAPVAVAWTRRRPAAAAPPPSRVDFKSSRSSRVLARESLTTCAYRGTRSSRLFRTAASRTSKYALEDANGAGSEDATSTDPRTRPRSLKSTAGKSLSAFASNDFDAFPPPPR